MKHGKLEFKPASDHLNLLADATAEALMTVDTDVFVAEINPDLADTAAFCEHYGISPGESANCVIVQAKRGDKVWYAACMILATDRVDVNNVVRRILDARKITFAPMETAVSLSGMEYGGITPIGLPEDWPILVDASVAKGDKLIIGSGLRGSKLLVSGKTLAHLPNAQVLNIALG